MELAIEVTLVGLTVVFLALIALSFMLDLFGVVFKGRKKGDNDREDKIVETKAAEKEEAAASEQVVTATSDEDLVALLAAAAAAFMGSGPDSKIIVKSFRRVPQDASIWSAAGRTEYIAGKL